MARRPRVHLPGGLYHAVLRGNHQQSIFAGADDHDRFERILASALDRHRAFAVAYCWMTNHVHIAVRIGQAPLGSIMGAVASRYARAKQRLLATTGHLFERRYHARLVDGERYLLALVRYIHLNPVRARLVTDPGEHCWSSHRHYLGAPPPPWLRIEPVLEVLGSSRAQALASYRQLMGDAPTPDELAAVRVAERLSRKPQGAGVRCSSSHLTARSGSPRSLDAIAAEVAAELSVSMPDIRSARRSAELVAARREIARRVLSEGAANLSQVARHLNRAPSSLSDLLRDRG